MIVMDLDGTLLTSDKNISNYTLSILDKCKNNGIKIVTASGRSEKASRRILDLVKPNLMILNGGSLVKDNNDKIIYKRLLSIKTSNELINECIKNENIGKIKVETEENDYINYEEPPYHQDYMHEKYYDFSNQLSKKIYKISIEMFDKKTLPIFEDKFTECKVIDYSGDSLCEFYPKEAGKMKAIEMILREKDIKLSDVIAFGNDYNDIEMIKRCGLGVAVENGIEEIRKTANLENENNQITIM
jgi:Cof subfamily protein (haloacid dehalogenase superfamily)